MAALEAAPAGFLHFTQLKRAQEEFTFHHLHRQQQHSQQKKQKVVGMIKYGSGGSFEDDDDSWEVRAFAEDTSSAMGTTWPPRFYSCSFCRREFRSAQALGGHMNVHRRDRARAHLHLPVPPRNIFPEAPAGVGAPCFLYPAESGTGLAFPSAIESTPSTFFSLSSAQISFAGPVSDISLLEKVGSSGKIADERSKDDGNGEELRAAEELDLELRLGW